MWKKKGNVHTRSDGLSVEDIPRMHLAIRHKKQIDWADLWRRMDFDGPIPIDPKIPGITILPGINLIQNDVEALKKQLDKAWPIANKTIWSQIGATHRRSDGVEIKEINFSIGPNNVQVAAQRGIGEWQQLWEKFGDGLSWKAEWENAISREDYCLFFIGKKVSSVKAEIDRIWPLAAIEKKSEEQVTLESLKAYVLALEDRVKRLEHR